MHLATAGQAERPSPTIFDNTEEKTSGAHFGGIVVTMLTIAFVCFLARGFGTSNYEKESHRTESNFKQKVTLEMETANVDIMEMR